MTSSKVMLITGASRGIGAAIALLAAKNGYNVVINYNNSYEKAIALQKQISSLGGNSIIFKADVSNADEVDSMIEFIHTEYGYIDVLVNNAGVSSFSMFTDITEKEWNRVFDINVKGSFIVSKAVIPDMVHNKYGKIINISSIWGITGSSCEVLYSATKSAIIGMTKALAKELGPSGINVNCVAPGVVDTDMNSVLTDEDIDALKQETPLCRIGNPEDIAESVLFLASDKSNFITGQVISPNGGIVI